MGLGRRPAELLAAHHVQDLPAEAPVAQQRRDVGVGGEAPEAVILPEEDGRRGADRGVGRIRVVEEGGIARIEADAAARGVDDRVHALKLAQRISRLNDIGPPARSLAGGKEDEPLGLEGVDGERPARGEVVGDGARADAAQAGERHMRRELAGLGRKPDPP